MLNKLSGAIALGALAAVSIVGLNISNAASIYPSATGSAAAQSSHSTAGTGSLASFTAQTMPACAGLLSPVALPASGFPSGFPFPPGTVVTKTEARSGGQLVTGVIPSNAHDVAVYFEQQFPTKGYKTGQGDSERGEAEALWVGEGYQGRWKVRDVQGCTGATTLTVFAGP